MSEFQVVAKDGVPLGIGDALLHGFVGQFFKQTEGVKTLLQDLALDLPQIVVVGQESSGKSSVLESLAMMPLFPRDESICTRMPIHLKMRHRQTRTGVSGSGSGSDSPTSEVETPQIKMRLVFSDGRAPVESDDGFQTEEVAQQMRTWMDEIVRGTNSDGSAVTGVVDHVLEIEVTSSQVPTLDLIDLPGIVAGRLVDEPEDMMHQTRALVEKYLKMPHTLVLAVVPAFERVRNSQAFQLVQQYGLEDRTIGVLTMVDRAIDVSNPKGPLVAVMDRLDEVSSDVVKLKHGYVAVKNRDTRTDQQPPLEEFKRDEVAWLEENLAGYVEKKLASSGILASKLEMLLAEHVRTTWVSQTIEKLTEGIENTGARIRDLSVDPQTVVDSLLVAEDTSTRYDLIRDLLGMKLAQAIEVADHEILPLVRVVTKEVKQKQSLMSVLPKTNRLLRRSALWAITSREAEISYFVEHFEDIMSSIALRLIRTVRRHLTLKLSTDEDISELDLFQTHRFEELYSLAVLVIWEKLQTLRESKDTLLTQVTRALSQPSVSLPSAQLNAASAQESLRQTLKDVNEFLETSLGEMPISLSSFIEDGDTPSTATKTTDASPFAAEASESQEKPSVIFKFGGVASPAGTNATGSLPKSGFSFGGVTSTAGSYEGNPKSGFSFGGTSSASRTSFSFGRTEAPCTGGIRGPPEPIELSSIAVPKSLREGLGFISSSWLQPVLLLLTEHALGCELRRHSCQVLGCSRVRRVLEREVTCARPCTCSGCVKAEEICTHAVKATVDQVIDGIATATTSELTQLFEHSKTCLQGDTCKNDSCHEARRIMTINYNCVATDCHHCKLVKNLGRSMLEERVMAATHTWGIPTEILMDLLATPSKPATKQDVQDIVELKEAERRMFTALGRHVVAPMLQALTDVTNLDFHLLAYLQNYPDVTAKPKHWFSESNQGERVRLNKKLSRLKNVREGLETLAGLGEL
ncbi:hypothetical protein Poli38472_009396 [Pythium oligandrum]|uniref:Dynamin-type G domain-containing protein n=1 Tax=Pythium oligandrum TaxID=41045 RepID=A0A8K1CKJ2_PYTOL|nr:hypothetical protein Poli38472_009396 [Pythium oligandrum]|eukprot:TMW65229.1 hypothetical protein Poli38472_009396 [Pythium oligandrum]